MHSSLKVEHISKSYGSRSVLTDVSMTLSEGEVVGLFGPNGAGKTTCFTIVVGLIKPDAGKLLLGDQDITPMPVHLKARCGISYLPQESSIFLGLTVRENIEAILEIAHRDRDTIARCCNELMEEFSISHLHDKPSPTLSGGERRRLEIARTLATNPKFIMMDEPFAGIDPLAISDVKRLILHLKKRNIGVLITDHNVRDTMDIVDRAYIIYDGKVLVHGTPEEIINNSEVRKVYLGQSFHTPLRPQF